MSGLIQAFVFLYFIAFVGTSTVLASDPEDPVTNTREVIVVVVLGIAWPAVLGLMVLQDVEW